uniref:Uncharacterized protein n=1 Tax=Meloidogyne enterolobii TaxID=390850 RepID=A0A6V7UXF8_MELEN|nr:unnamed protein product [Meloidogyne enterolobii]
MFSYLIRQSARQCSTGTIFGKLPFMKFMRMGDFLTKKEEITDTPPSLYNWRKGLKIERDSMLASENLWLSGSRQLNVFLDIYGLHCPDEELMTDIVLYLADNCVDEKAKRTLKFTWTSLLLAQDNARDGDFNLRYVKNFLIRPNEYFCDSLIKIYESNRFDRQTMLNKLPRDIKDKLEIKYEGKWIKCNVFEYINGLSEDERNGLIAKHGDKWIEFVIEELKQSKKVEERRQNDL